MSWSVKYYRSAAAAAMGRKGEEVWFVLNTRVGATVRKLSAC